MLTFQTSIEFLDSNQEDPRELFVSPSLVQPPSSHIQPSTSSQTQRPTVHTQPSTSRIQPTTSSHVPRPTPRTARGRQDIATTAAVKELINIEEKKVQTLERIAAAQEDIAAAQTSTAESMKLIAEAYVKVRYKIFSKLIYYSIFLKNIKEKYINRYYNYINYLFKNL